jgi:hypothetical protein
LFLIRNGFPANGKRSFQTASNSLIINNIKNGIVPVLLTKKKTTYPKINTPIMKTLLKSIVAANLFVVAMAGSATAAGLPEPPAPVAYDISMSPLVQASLILPFKASSATSNIAAFTVQSIPQSFLGILSIDMHGILMPVSEGMMLTTDLAESLVFTPDTAYTGTVIFTYSASDDEGFSSNIASYTIPVVKKPQAILPISLLHFNGAAENKKVQLYWQTENEGNSSYFELQRSADGNNFETIATVTAKGSTATKNNYQHTDDLFFYTYQTVYYRIKMVDINGGFKYSPDVTIQFGTITKTAVKAWPMPFAGTLNVEYTSDAKEMVKITIRSVNGSTVMSMSNAVKKGTNIISLYQAQTIPAGTYLLTLSNGTKAETIKVIKQ